MRRNALSLELATRTEALVCTETVLFAVTNVVAILGNLLTFYAVYRNHRLRTIPNMFLIALALSDILMSTICIPFTVASLFHGRWIFDETVCRFQAFDIFAFGTSSLGTMAAIAVSRYFCVVNREKYPSLFKKQRSVIDTFSLFGAWLWLDLLPHYSSKMAALSSSLEKQCVCTKLKVTLLTLSLCTAVLSQHP